MRTRWVHPLSQSCRLALWRNVRFVHDPLIVLLRLLSSLSCRREVGASWTDVAVMTDAVMTDRVITLGAGSGGPAAEGAGLVARPLPLGELALVVALLSCARGLHYDMPLRVWLRSRCPCGYSCVERRKQHRPGIATGTNDINHSTHKSTNQP